MIKIFIYLSTLYFLIHCVISAYYNKLRFNENNEFTILQFTDLHYGESLEKDINTTILQEKLINYTKPDLVIITGDSVSGYAWNGLNQTFYSDCWKLWTSSMEKLKIPYAYALGNHDDEADLTRKQIIDLDQTNKYSLSQYNSECTGATNYFIPIKSNNLSHSDEPLPYCGYSTQMTRCAMV